MKISGMTHQTVHILNGDALRARFPYKEMPAVVDKCPKSAQNAGITRAHPNSQHPIVIVMRECLVDGDLSGEIPEPGRAVTSNPDSFYHVRANYLDTAYGATTFEAYLAGSVSEFERMQQLPHGSEVHLWFEDDLFCQVNAWFVVYLLLRATRGVTHQHSLYLVRPAEHTSRGFGGLTDQALRQAMNNKIRLHQPEKLAHLWELFRECRIAEESKTGGGGEVNGSRTSDLSGRGERLYYQTETLHKAARDLGREYSFILKAVEAYIESLPRGLDPGRPVKTVIDIMEEYGTEEFAVVFQEFCRRESIYGYGDLQVKRIFDQVLTDREKQSGAGGARQDLGSE